MNPAADTPVIPDVSLRELQATVDRWISSTGAGYFSELTNMAVLAEEVGEVARIMARRFGDQRAKPGDERCLADELADVVWVVAAIANQTGVDLTQAIAANIAKKNARDSHRFDRRADAGPNTATDRPADRMPNKTES